MTVANVAGESKNSNDKYLFNDKYTKSLKVHETGPRQQRYKKKG